MVRSVSSFMLSLLVTLLVTASPPAQAQDKTLTVFAAASMKNALDDVNAAYTKKTGVKVVTDRKSVV